MKNKILILVSILVLTCMLCACGESVLTVPVRIEGSIFGCNPETDVQLNVEYSSNWLTNRNNDEYNPNLARFASVAIVDTYFREKDIEKGTQNRVCLENAAGDSHDRAAFFTSLGFTDVKFVESYKEKEYSADGNDSVTMTMAYCGTEEKYDVFAVVVRGCFSIQEWCSIFDPGADNEAYVKLSGEHPEWTDKNRFKGLDIASARALEFIDSFVKEHDDPDKGNCILVTGHSRGGSIANIIGAELEKRGDSLTRTYTFSAMNVTTDENAGDYKTIFNLFDSNDFYTDVLPFGEERFYRYGRDLSVSVKDSEEILDKISKVLSAENYECASEEGLTQYHEVFSEMFSNRASLYEPRTITQKSDSKEKAEELKNTLEVLLGSEQGLGLDGICSAEITGDSTVALTYSGATLLQAYAKVLAYGSPAYEAFTQLFDGDEDACRIASFMNENAAGISCAHRLADDYVIASYVK